MTKKRTIFWFRQDLRVSDNPGLLEAANQGEVMPIYILDEVQENPFPMGQASRWWLHHSLTQLSASLTHKLNVYLGNPQEIIPRLVRDHNLDAVYWNRCYEPWRIQEDTALKTYLKNNTIECKSFNASLLWEPWDVLKKDQSPYKVFTPFYRNGCRQGSLPRHPLPQPDRLTLLLDQSNKTTITSLNLLPENNWHKKLEPSWTIGEEAAQNRLITFLDEGLPGYKDKRNYPDKPNTSRLSPHLHFGEISPHQVWHSVQAHGTLNPVYEDVDCFLSELGWREFSYYLLYHFPDLPKSNFQGKFDAFPWEYNADYLDCWQKGQTGFPLVDAGMRELWQTGYMHNRVRMITASFLVKNLLIHWHHGEDWFWDCLVDADLANNSASWQWVAGSGADASPYFRIFNPIAQGEKFDPEGHYTRRYVPELKNLPNEYLFRPWEAPDHVLKSSGIILGKTYPNPIVNFSQTRDRALQAYRVSLLR